MSAEGPSRSWKPGIQVKTTMADPRANCRDRAKYHPEHPPNAAKVSFGSGCRWNPMTSTGPGPRWRPYRQGRAPQQRYAAEIKTLSPGLYEVWVANTGETSGDGSLRCEILWQDARPARVRSGEHVPGGTRKLGNRRYYFRARPPRQGKSIMVGWFRFNPDNSLLDAPAPHGKGGDSPLSAGCLWSYCSWWNFTTGSDIIPPWSDSTVSAVLDRPTDSLRILGDSR